MTGDISQNRPGSSRKTDREERLEKALRENLKRRKQQARARSVAPDVSDDQNSATLGGERDPEKRDGE